MQSKLKTIISATGLEVSFDASTVTLTFVSSNKSAVAFLSGQMAADLAKSLIAAATQAGYNPKDDPDMVENPRSLLNGGSS